MHGAVHPTVAVAFRLMLNEAQGRARFEPLPEEEEAAFGDAAATLAKRLPCWGSFPADAQLAMLRWAWVNGASSKRFAALFQALKPAPGRPLPDFALAAEACCWFDMSLPARLTMNALWQNAADSLTWGLPADKLIWPGVFRRAALPAEPPPKQPQGGVRPAVKLAIVATAGAVFAFQMGKRRGKKAAEAAAEAAAEVERALNSPAVAEKLGAYSLPDGTKVMPALLAGTAPEKPKTAEEVKAGIVALMSRAPHQPLPRLTMKRGWHGAPTATEVRRLSMVSSDDVDQYDEDELPVEPEMSFGAEDSCEGEGDDE